MDSAIITRYSNNTLGFTEYSIKVFHLGLEWLIKKRFSDFTTLDSALKSSGIAVPAQLPQKNWLSKFDVDFLLKRAKALQIYLDKMMTISPIPSLVKEFLEFEKHMLANDLKKHKSLKSIRKTDKISAIVNRAKDKFIIINPKERVNLTVRRLIQQSFPNIGPSTPSFGKKGTSSFNNDYHRGRSETHSMAKSSPKNSFSTTVLGEDVSQHSNGSHHSHQPAAAAAAKVALQVAEYRSFIERRMLDCFSRKAYLLSYMQYDQFMAMVPSFPDDTSELMNILVSRIPEVLLAGNHVLDNAALVIEAKQNNLFAAEDSPDCSAKFALIADNQLFTDPPPPSPTKGPKPLSRVNSQAGEGGPGLMIRRTTQDSGSNRPPGSYRPAVPYDLG